MFSSFERDQQPKLKCVPVFAKGVKYYSDLSDQILQELESDIDRTQKEAEGLKILKEAQLKQLSMLFEMNTHNLAARQKLDEAVSTLREVPVFGYNTQLPDFKWPTASDLLKMPTHTAIHVSKLRWKKSSRDNERFGAIQVVLSNGVESPLFLSKGQTPENLTEVAISPETRSIRGTANNERLTAIFLLN